MGDVTWPILILTFKPITYGAQGAYISMHRLRLFWTDESGAAAAEYALILAFIAVVIVVGLKALGNGVSNTFNAAGAKLPSS